MTVEIVFPSLIVPCLLGAEVPRDHGSYFFRHYFRTEMQYDADIAYL